MKQPEPTPPLVKIVVRFEDREDGGPRVWSDDIPGFVLSGRHPAKVPGKVESGLETIVGAMYGKPVSVARLVWASSFKPHEELAAATGGEREYASLLAA